jgi:16S rRNA A1518/A1519 N6-dimethyltransferase RsmA/KsgA/DIM1 with predicted DNA glycosylase/AP lyase activity
MIQIPIIFYFITGLTLFLAFLLFFFLIIDLSNLLIRKIPSLSTSSKVIQFIVKILEQRRGNVFIDLGCGRGKLVVAVKKKYPEIEVRGYENWPTQFFLAKLLAFLFRVKVKIFYQDLFSANLQEADVIFCYLPSNLMLTLEKKMEKELKNEAIIIANTFPFPNWTPIQIIITNSKNPNYGKLFIYEFKKEKI